MRGAQYRAITWWMVNNGIDVEEWNPETDPHLPEVRVGDTAYRTYNTQGRGVEQVSHTFPLIDLLPYGRQEMREDSPAGWPQDETYGGWPEPQDVAGWYGDS